jgi:FkbM family methyltransferase
MFQKFKRFGKYRIINAESRWGVDLFDDLAKLATADTFRTVVDVGANRGDFSELFLRQFPSATVHALEPVQTTFDRLQERLSSKPRMRFHRLAASDKSGTALIRTFESSEKNTLVTDLKDSLRINAIGEEEIKTQRLDEFFGEIKLQQVDLLKIDVEGFEMKVLEGCGSYLEPSRIRYIFYEFHRVREANSLVAGHTRLCEVDSLLDSLGYRFVTVYTQGVHANEPIGTYNALYGPSV